MRLLLTSLVALLVLIQYPLWLGKGGWLRVWELDRQIEAQQRANIALSQRNSAMEGEVRDLRQGLVAVEERARYELGMVRADEVFVQINGLGAEHRSASPGPRSGQGAPGGGPPQLRTAQTQR